MAAGCGKFAAKTFLTDFKIYSENINAKSEISKLLTFPCFESGDIKFSKFDFRTEVPVHVKGVILCIRREYVHTLDIGCYFLLIVSENEKHRVII